MFKRSKLCEKGLQSLATKGKKSSKMSKLKLYIWSSVNVSQALFIILHYQSCVPDVAYGLPLKKQNKLRAAMQSSSLNEFGF